jgi:hypothetical protein
LVFKNYLIIKNSFFKLFLDVTLYSSREINEILDNMKKKIIISAILILSTLSAQIEPAL